jgi:hypothetical protein
MMASKLISIIVASKGVFKYQTTDSHIYEHYKDALAHQNNLLRDEMIANEFKKIDVGVKFDTNCVNIEYTDDGDDEITYNYIQTANDYKIRQTFRKEIFPRSHPVYIDSNNGFIPITEDTDSPKSAPIDIPCNYKK